MPKHIVVAAGESLISLAHAHKVFDWKKIWEHPANAALRKLRKHAQVLAPGDKLTIPDPTPREVTVPSGRAKFKRKKPPCFFTVFLKDEQSKPFANVRYKLVVGGVTFEGTTGGDGKVSHPVAPDVRDGDLTMWRRADKPDDKSTWKVKVGSLNPVESVSGIKGRLKNLGYDVGNVNELLDDKTRAAIRDFRMHRGLDTATDAIDDAVRDGLLELHGKF